MSFVLLVILGAAAGFIASRIMDFDASLPVIVAIGILGALIGWVLLRVLLALTGLAFGLVGAVLGAVLLIWLWQVITEGNHRR